MTFMKPTIVVATNNKNKVAEIQAAAKTANLDYTFRGIYELIPDWESPVEDGLTFEDNAAIKARAGFEALNLPTVADDSGLMVAALSGGPGVNTSSYAGKEGDDEANNAKLLEEMEGIEPERRSASFVTVLVLVGLDTLIPDAPDYITEEAACDGTIGQHLQGEGGFGYDPLFHPALQRRISRRSMAQMTIEEKNEISHRGLALKQLMDTLKSF